MAVSGSGFLTEIKRCIGKGLVDVQGRFYPNTSSAIDNAKNVGGGWSVAYTSTGLYTITFKKQWAALVSFSAMLQLDTPAAAHDLVMGVYSASAKTITLYHYSGGSLADVTAATNSWIHFRATFKNTLAPG